MSTRERSIDLDMKQVIAETFSEDWVWKQHVTSSLGQRICVVARKTLGGKIALYLLTDDERLTPSICKPVKIAHVKGDLAEAKAVASRFCDSVTQSPFAFTFTNQPEGISLAVDKETMRVVPLPGSALHYPDNFLEHGDEVLVQCKMLGFNFYHAGIYQRGGYVYHFMLASGGAVLFDSWNNFVYALNEPGTEPTICRLSHILRVRSGEDVVNCASSLYCNHSEFVEYDLRDRNCQHFASFCARGVQFSFEMASNLTYLACSLVKPSNAIFGSIQKIASIPSSLLSSDSA
ncbi:hypothetical protein Tcan_17343 [Toxocara canis]|uniref:LRAT domain-containing protein n=2 Tax=Toxocara canis TaxID=6265 RepID=A0A0B2UNB6_TOXCA|nr:hypothetical protein Tcan_17343 [Toxocara canis]VDM38008.1 unnamed protein product [Toxocara canis]